MKILTTILTCTSTQHRANACLATWIKDIKTPHDYIFFGDKKQSHKMDKTWNCEPDEGEKRDSLPEKTYKMLVKSLDYEWDFLFKCDDDTYVAFDKLINLLKNYNPDDELYIGGKIVNPFPYAQGGAGYALTRSAVKKCIESLKHFYKDAVPGYPLRAKTRNAEDYSVGLALKEQGINLTHADLLSTPNLKTAKQNQSVCIDAIIKKHKITTHYVMPETMEKLHKMRNTI